MKKQTRIISFSGKGGTGKTTTASLFVKAVKSLGLCDQILVIDADPDANLATTLNVKYETTIGEAVDKRKKTLDEGVAGEKLRRKHNYQRKVRDSNENSSVNVRRDI